MVQLADSEATASEGRAPMGNIRSHRMTNAAYVFGAFATVMFALFMVRLGIGANAVPPESQALMWVAIIAGAIVTLLLLAGTVLMWRRQPAGHVIVIVASALGIAYAVSFTAYNYFHGPDAYGSGDIGMVLVQVLLGVAPALVALVCAAVASASRTTARVL